MQTISRFLLSAAFVAALGVSRVASAQTLANETKLTPIAPPLQYSGEGNSVAISFNTAVVGAPFGTPGTGGPGSAHVFVRGVFGWTYQATLFPDEPDPTGQFGGRVAIQGDTILVASQFSSFATHGLGRVYVFERTGKVWNQTAKLEAVADFGDTTFGTAVALDGDTAVIGDFGNDPDPGRLIVVNRVGGVWHNANQIVLDSPNPKPGAALGSSVSIQGDILVGGAPNDTVFGQHIGGAQIFKRTQGVWNPFGDLITNDLEDGAGFGTSVSLDGELIVVGEPFADNGRGRAYVFHQTQNGAWSDLPAFWTKLFPKTPQVDENFGFFVQKSGANVLVGAPFHDNARGAVFIYNDLTGTSNGTMVLASDGVAGDQYGVATALDGSLAAVGANIQNQIGVAYAYDIKPPIPRFNWNLHLWPYKYIYMGCPIDLVQNGEATITIERGEIPLSFSFGVMPRHGTVRFTSPATIEYVPHQGFVGRDEFTVRVTDRAGNVLEKTANVKVFPKEVLRETISIR